LTPVQQKWLQHLRAAERSGGTIKDYAARKSLPVRSLYQAGKRLRRLGLLEPRVRRKAKTARSRFIKVERSRTQRETDPTWRIRLSNGAIFESNAFLTHDELLSLLVGLAAPR
jgi:hypothetical protein